MGLSELLLSAWLALPMGWQAPLDASALPEDAGPVSLAKTDTDLDTSDGISDGGTAKRPWTASGAPIPIDGRWCQVNLRGDFGSRARMMPGMSERDIDAFALAHEVGHCMDQSPHPPGESERESIRREAFADAFAACAISMEGHAAAARGIALMRSETLPRRQGWIQKRAIDRAAANPSCQPPGGIAAVEWPGRGWDKAQPAPSAREQAEAAAQAAADAVGAAMS